MTLQLAIVGATQLARSLQSRALQSGINSAQFELNAAGAFPEAADTNLAHAEAVLAVDERPTGGGMQVLDLLDRLCTHAEVLALCSSAANPTAVAAGLSRPQRVLVLHFPDSLLRARTVEVVAGLQSGDGALEHVTALLEALQFKPIRVKNRPGFLLSRLCIPLADEALRLTETGVLSETQLESVAHGLGFAEGPLAALRRTGYRRLLVQQNQIFEDTGFHSRFRPTSLLRDLAAAETDVPGEEEALR